MPPIPVIPPDAKEDAMDPSDAPEVVPCITISLADLLAPSPCLHLEDQKITAEDHLQRMRSV